MSEVINARFDDGAWRSIPPVKKHARSVNALFVHVLEDREHLIFYQKNTESVGYMNSVGSTFEIYDHAIHSDFVFAQYKNVLIISSEADLYRKYCIWEATLNTYQVVDLADVNIDLRFFGVFTDLAGNYGLGPVTISPQYVHCSDMTMHNSKLNGTKRHGFFYGELLVCCAIETVYGDVIKHSAPQFVRVGMNGIVGESELGWASKYDFEIGFLASIFESGSINDNFFDNIETYRKLISSINIYITDISQGTYSSEYGTIAKDYGDDNFVKNSVFFLAYKYSIDEIKTIGKNKTFMTYVNGAADFDPTYITLRLPGDLTDILTRDEMPVDNFSHHVIVEGNNHVYNNRLLLMDIKMKLTALNVSLFSFIKEAKHASPHYSHFVSEFIGVFDVFSVVKLKTASGIKVVQSDVSTVNSYYIISYTAVFNRLITFPDPRAFEIQIYIKIHGSANPYTNLLKSAPFVAMKQHAVHSFSYLAISKDASQGSPETIISNHFLYHVDDEFAYFSDLAFGTTQPSHTVNNIVTDINRVQASAVDNVFYFPAINSYQVGSSRVLALSENTIPTSTGQFGSYPLVAFTESGIWALNIDPSGETFITSITPISDDQLSSAQSVTKAGNIIVFSTAKGIAIMAGQEVKYISSLIDGVDFKTKLHGNTKFVAMSNGADYGPFKDLLTTTNLNSFIGKTIGMGSGQTCIMGFDSVNSDLIISNPSYKYSWVYSFAHQIWTKRDISYRRFLTGRNRTYGLLNVEDGNQLYILGENSADTYTGSYPQDSKCEPKLFAPMVFITQPFQAEASDAFFKIRQLYVDGSGIIAGGKMLGVFLYSSPDGENWFLNSLSARKGSDNETKFRNLETSRSGFSAKYHIIAIYGILGDVYLAPDIELTFVEKYTSKSR